MYKPVISQFLKENHGYEIYFIDYPNKDEFDMRMIKEGRVYNNTIRWEDIENLSFDDVKLRFDTILAKVKNELERLEANWNAQNV